MRLTSSNSPVWGQGPCFRDDMLNFLGWGEGARGRLEILGKVWRREEEGPAVVTNPAKSGNNYHGSHLTVFKSFSHALYYFPASSHHLMKSDKIQVLKCFSFRYVCTYGIKHLSKRSILISILNTWQIILTDPCFRCRLPVYFWRTGWRGRAFPTLKCWW